MLRFRTVLLAIVGISLAVFALSYFIYRYLFKKELKNNKLNGLMLVLIVAGGVLTYNPLKQYIQ
ncbi:hypothetical protein JNUCC83_04035 [Vagococcus sp. JNUCC 83]